jgi:two-component system, OmpR family, phosphate regulon response regulator PhoB
MFHMRRITIIIVNSKDGDLDPHNSEALDIQFYPWDGLSEINGLNGFIWAFVDATKSATRGFEICQRLRSMAQTASAQIVLTLNQNDEETRRQAKVAGANLCISNPVNRKQMINMVTSFSWHDDVKDEPARLEFSDLVIDVLALQARWQGKPVALMPNEFHLLRFFVQHPGRVYTRTQIINMLGKQKEWVDERTVDAWVGRLRKHLKAAGAPNILRTVRSFGFILDLP